MKSTLLALTLSLCLAGPVWAQDDSDSSSPPSPPPGGHHHFGGLTQDERTELKTAHDGALQAHPELAAQGKQLQEEFKDYQKKMHDAMVAADPKVEPILEKMHHHHFGPPPGSGDDGSANP